MATAKELLAELHELRARRQRGAARLGVAERLAVLRTEAERFKADNGLDLPVFPELGARPEAPAAEAGLGRATRARRRVRSR